MSQQQASSLERQQIAEFKKRYKSRTIAGGNLPGAYAGRSSDSRSELVLCVNGNGECIGCAGVEGEKRSAILNHGFYKLFSKKNLYFFREIVDKVKKMDGYDGSITGPVMSNLAIGRSYRRKGLAEDLVRATENIARKEWGYDECYLYVEKRNTPAIKLYKKLGYSFMWEDPTATTLLPTSDGRVASGKTTIVCMKKKLGGGLFANLFAAN